MSAPATMTPAQIADELQIDEATFLARRPRLQREFGFPRTLPGCMLRWSRVQVLAWINGPGEYEEPEKPRLVVDNARAALEERYVGGNK